METVFVEIRKPLNGNYCCIRDKYINEATKRGVNLTVAIPSGEFEVNPKDFMHGAKKMKKVFLVPDKPMVLYCNYIGGDKHDK